jgi:phosphatidylglycerophosphate synthase
LSHSIDELRAICQTRIEKQPFYERRFARLFSIYITRVLILTPITANQTTLLYILVGILAASCFTFGTVGLNIAGIVLLQLWYIMDCVDGEVARYRGTTSVTGVYLDLLSHYIAHPLVIACIGWGLFRKFDDSKALIFAFSAALFVVLHDLVHHCPYVAAYIALEMAHRRGTLPLLRLEPEAIETAGDFIRMRRWEGSLPRRIVRGIGLFLFYRMDLLYRAPGFVNVITVAVLVTIILPRILLGSLTVDPLYLVIIAYGVVLPTVFVGSAGLVVRNRTAERLRDRLLVWLEYTKE